MNEEIGEQFSDIRSWKAGDIERPAETNPCPMNVHFFTDLYKDGVGEKIEEMFREMIAGPGAVKATIHKYVH